MYIGICSLLLVAAVGATVPPPSGLFKLVPHTAHAALPAPVPTPSKPELKIEFSVSQLNEF